MSPRSLRPVDLAREHGLSTQAVRNYEDEGILPPAARTASGYRSYTPAHAQALRAFLALRPGYGHGVAAEILRCAHREDTGTLFRLIDGAHAELLHERDTLAEVTTALGALTAEPRTYPRTRTRTDPTVGTLARQLGLHPASLRKWEAAGILRPRRDPATGHRRYPPEAVRDAYVARQLRRGGFPLDRIRVFTEQLRGAGDAGALGEVLAEWHGRLDRRSRAMLAAGRELDAYLDLVEGS
ncbi:MerR family transcriptional regulator [Streptomyces spiroverticillatus]|uniref:MerR family transcriptional regulator n=1 Tax=Streptomyces finlayi TaxID=67296 RepID=A0A918X1U9_9ACTN|nr:MerR family transcriptional regulator [Streptomyces finlayi]GHA21656.1 MerR family transcriptional regulator [Streptomyces spiroverticillatus]GHD03944.1 MerR family transcriptional regulator [Streptomyces finlayi]